jgi:hypothetical protein
VNTAKFPADSAPAGRKFTGFESRIAIACRLRSRDWRVCGSSIGVMRRRVESRLGGAHELVPFVDCP